MSLRVGIFGGTFNPIHIGHLALANYLREFEGLDEVWFMVSPQNPFKKDQILLYGRYAKQIGASLSRAQLYAHNRSRQLEFVL